MVSFTFGKLQANELLTNGIEKIHQATSYDELKVIEQQLLEQFDDVADVTILQHSARKQYQLDEFEKALQTLARALQIAEQKQLITAQAYTNKLLGALHYFNGNIRVAIDYYSEAADFYLQANELVEVAHVQSNLGLAYGDVADFERALEYMMMAKKTYLEKGDKVDLIDIQSNIANIYIRLKEFDEAISIYQEALKGYFEINDLEGVAIIDGDLGIALYSMKQYEQAKFHMQRSLSYYREKQDNYHAASQLHNLAELETAMLNQDAAINNAIEAQRLGKVTNNLRLLKNTGVTLAKLHLWKSDFERAQEQITMVANLLQEHPDIETQQEISLYETLMAAREGNGELIYKSLAKYRVNKDSYLNELKNQELASLQNQIKTQDLNQQLSELKQQQIRQLNLAEQAKLKQYVTALVLLIIFFVLFVVYRRNLERESNIKLSELVEKRTQELTETTAQLKQAATVKDQFLANMSHEIRTPLTAVLGQAESILNGEVEPSGVQHEVSIIHKNGHHLLELLNDILDLTKIEQGKLEIENAPVAVSPLLLELENMFVEQAHTKGLDLCIDQSVDSRFAIESDGFRLKQILINLLSNAIKFTTKGEVSLSVEIQHEMVSFNVKDSGIGLSVQQQQEVFEAFKQADSSISRRFGGSGLGLSLSQKLAQQLGGEISISSEQGVGSTFSLSIPLLEVELDDTQLNPSSSLCDSELDVSGTVLLAEDHPDNRRLVARILENFGLHVIVAENGMEAFKLALEHQPDLILMDIQMPELDGLTAREYIHKVMPETPIVALTANAMKHEVAEYLAVGFAAHLNKPIERTLLRDVVSQYISAQPAADDFDFPDLSDLSVRFKATWSDELKTLQQLHDSQDIEGLAKWAHRLSGAAAMFEFQSVAGTAQRLELNIKNQQHDAIDAQVSELNELLSDSSNC